MSLLALDQFAPAPCLEEIEIRSATLCESLPRLLDALNVRALATHTKLDGRLVVRLSTGQRTTESAHVDEAWATIVGAA